MTAVYKAIAAVQGELAKAGISKDGVNQSQNYKFRGIDQVYGALSPLLAKHGLCVLPRIVKRDMFERVTVKPGYKPNDPPKESVLFYVTVEAEFDFVAVEDGSCHVVKTFGEAMDSGDKATNKAMSAAYKYAAFMAFAIPTEGDNDADATTHEISPGPAARTKLDGPHTSKTALMNAIKKLTGEIGAARSIEEIDVLLKGNATVKQAQRDWPELLDGEPGNEDIRGLKAYVAERRAALSEPQDEMLAMLLDTMKQSQTLRSFTAWMAANEGFIDGLSDPDRRTLERESEVFESGLKAQALTEAG